MVILLMIVVLVVFLVITHKIFTQNDVAEIEEDVTNVFKKPIVVVTPVIVKKKLPVKKVKAVMKKRSKKK